MIGQFNSPQTKDIHPSVERMVKEDIATVENDIVKKTSEIFIGALTNHYKLTTEEKWTYVKNC